MSAAMTPFRDAAAAVAAAGAPIRDATADDAIDGIAPVLVASPTSTEQVAGVLRACAEHRLAVVARGAGTKISWGTPPDLLDLIIDVSGLDRVVEHAAGDLIVVAEAGVRLADLNRLIGQAGQHLAVDETVTGATVGGTICSASSGPQRLLRGTVRDLLIGLTFVRADGKVVHAGGRVVKNVAGYDLCKLLVGSYGTLGVVTQATFRLHPLPQARRVVSMVCDRPQDARDLVARIVHSQTVPSAIELDWPNDARLVVAALLEGSPVGVDERAATIAGLAGPGASISDTLPDWWGRYPWTPRTAAGETAISTDTALKLTFPVSQLHAVLDCFTALRRDGQVTLSMRGSAGTGVLYAAAHPTDASIEASVLTAHLLARLRMTCGADGGHVVVLDAPADVKRAVDVWGPVRGLDLMRRVKREFDPEHRLSPGRFVGGI
ncbi:MAG TPA: FAD-binding oxidoreductase [Actinopolymorphaceae bacterium]|jgi:glycolate oxidase FAD binding subunit